MINKNIFSCFIVGDDNLTLQCAEIILAENHQLLGIISKSSHIKIWCANHTIPYICSIEEFETRFKEYSFDFLFSIVNSQILPQSILNLPRFYAINYHNSPLPKYAGLYATTWAILNGESEHAISWHKMEEIVDAGSILKQPSFPIDTEDTSLSLNLKCYEHAVSSFRELVTELATNSISSISQNLNARSYYGLKNKPEALGFISCEQSAEQIDRLCKALTFGHYTNELATPKVVIKGEVFVIHSHKKLNQYSGLKPGSIISISSKSIEISTKTSDVALLELTDLYGKSQQIDDLAQRLGLSVNSSFDSINNDLIEKLESSLALSPKAEKFWVNEFLKAEPETLFLSSSLKSDNSSCNSKKITTIPKPLLEKINGFSNEPDNSKQVLLTIALVYFYRLNNYKNYSVAYSNESLRKAYSDLSLLLSDYLPLTTQLDSNMSFSEVFQVVSDSYSKLSQHKSFVKDIFVRYPELSDTYHPMEVSIVFIDKVAPTKYHFESPLTLYCFEDCSGFYVHHKVQDSAGILSHHFLEQINSHLLTLLEDAITNPDKKLYELSFLDTEEKTSLMVSWNNTQSKFDKKKPLHHYFEEQVLKNPKAIAAVFKNCSLTYDELNQKSNRLAHCLKNQGIKPNQLVGVFLNRGLEMIISILGILKSGGTYLPLDPNYPEGRISYMLHNSQCSWLIMDKQTSKNKPQGYDKAILEIGDLLSLNTLSDENLENINIPSDLGYVIYTSGTTGNPKGVAIPHQAICNHMLWMKKNYSFHATDVFLQKTPFSFDASVWEFFMPLFVGGKLIIAPNDAHACPTQLINLVQKHQVSVLQLVPSMLKELSITDGFHRCISLRHVFCGGEALSPETINSFFKLNIGSAKLHNLYGPTECTIDAVTHTCTEEDRINNGSLIGKPINNTKVYVLDSQLQPVPVGVTGELYLSGEGLAQGYLNNPKATKEKFIKNPFEKSPYNRLYKTGDLVKWNAKGVLEYHGRCDNQVKIRGYRIELNEVEYAIDRLPFIHQCIVVPELNQNGLMSLTAYISLNKENDVNPSNIRTQLNKTLPEYMIPSRFFEVDHLFSTPGGKLDRKNIPTPLRQIGLDKQHREPRTEIEHELEKLWCTALNIENIGIDDDFFNLGGNSLSAMKIISSINERFSINLTIRTIFDFPTIETLATAIKKRQGGMPFKLADYHDSSFVVSIKKEGSSTPLFLVHPIGGSVFWYKNIANYLDKIQPLYGIQDPGLDKQDYLFNSLEEMASYYIKAIQTIQPNGPYLLGGASFGSTVAIEMAKQLQEQNETVIAILSLDGWAYYPSLQNDAVYFQKKMKEQNDRILKHYIKHNIANAQFLLELQWHREQMLTRYKLPMIETKFILFKAQELSEIFQYEADLNWWESYTKNEIELYITPGDHESMFFEPNIQDLTTNMNRAINKLLFEYSLCSNMTDYSLQEPSSS